MMKYMVSALLLGFLLLPPTSSAGTLDNYYLERFEGLYGTGQAFPVGIQTTTAAGSERCLTPLYHGLRKDWSKLESSTQGILAKYLAKPVLAGEKVYVSGHFSIHYATTGTDAPPPADDDGDGTPDWVQTVATTFEYVHSVETTQMGYRPAATVSGGPYEVYLKDLAVTREFGYTQSDSAVAPDSTVFTSHIVIDNNFTDAVYASYPPLKGLQVTAAHEYHHAIQYGYNFYFDIWYAEATSTWMEDEVYDTVNQLYDYLPAYFHNSTLSLDSSSSVTTGGGYGRWLFNRYLAEKYTGQAIKGYWERLATLPAPADGSDIPALPTLTEAIKTSFSGSLGDDFFTFAKRIYTRDWASHPEDTGLIGAYVPLATFSVYPVNGTSGSIPQITLPHYSFAYYRFVPSPSAPVDLVVTFTNSPGISVAGFNKSSGGIVTRYAFDPATATLTIPSFNSAATAEAVILVCNASTNDALTASFTTDGSAIPLPASSSSSSSSSASNAAGDTGGSGGGGGGCFIATAAYGSYLHPKVMILREFRDRYLLTNGPGRAFVRLYYAASPPLAALIARHDWARTLCRMALAPIIMAVEYKAAVLRFFLLGGFPLICAGWFARRRLSVRSEKI